MSTTRGTDAAQYTFNLEHGIYTTEWGEPVWARVELDMLRQERSGELTGEVTVRSTTPGLEDHLHTARMTLTGTRSRAEVARHLKSRDQTARDWAGIVEVACVRTVNAFRAGEPAILLRDAPQPIDAGYAVEPVAHSRLPVTVFGDGGGGKSWLALAIAASIQAGTSYVDGLAVSSSRTVGYLDYEMSAWEHRERLRALTGPDMPGIVYVPCHQSLRDSVDRLRRIAREHGIGYWVVDSVAPACGGEPESAEVATAYFNALRELGGGSLSIAHITKDREGAENKPFGSTFWHNLSRLTWYVKGTEDGAGRLAVGLYNRKNNTGPLHAPLGLAITFGEAGVSIGKSAIDKVPELAERLPLWRRMVPLLRGGPLKLHELAEELDASVEAVRAAAKRGRQFTAMTGPDGIERWALATSREEPAA